MIEEYGLKCWYSEAPIGNGIFEIDHFRPKNRARQDDEESTINNIKATLFSYPIMSIYYPGSNQKIHWIQLLSLPHSQLHDKRTRIHYPNINY